MAHLVSNIHPNHITKHICPDGVHIPDKCIVVVYCGGISIAIYLVYQVVILLWLVQVFPKFFKNIVPEIVYGILAVEGERPAFPCIGSETYVVVVTVIQVEGLSDENLIVLTELTEHVVVEPILAVRVDCTIMVISEQTRCANCGSFSLPLAVVSTVLRVLDVHVVLEVAEAPYFLYGECLVEFIVNLLKEPLEA